MPDSSTTSPDSTISSKSPFVLPGKPVFPVYQKLSPFREPSWRWLRAQEIVEAGELISAKTDDLWTRRAANYLKALASCENRRPSMCLLRKMGDIALAHQLSEQDEIRWTVEAELLGREPLADVARKAGVEPEAIIAFESLFFNVLDRLECSSYIRLKVLGKKCHYDLLTLDDKDILLKVFGYYGGPLILKHFAPYVLDPKADLSFISPLHRELAPKIRRVLAMLTTRFKWPSRAKSKQVMEQSEPLTVEQVEAMILAAIAKGETTLHPVKRKIKPHRAGMAKSSKPENVLRSLACGGE